jgi:predicted  nucleic acid-binding Zn-ribbon protein
VQTARTQVTEAQSRVDAEAGLLQAEVARVRAELVTVERDLVDDVRDRYDRVVRSKGADGLAAVDGQTCGGCFQQITGNMLSDLILGKAVVCRNCGRLLYMPEGPRPA